MTPSHIQDDWVSIELEQGLPQLRELDERAQSQFKHQRLEKGKYFRLLRLHSNPVQGDFIHCRLQHFELESAPPYRAVSYVWGDPGPNRVIYIGEPPYREIEVGENLYNLLLCVRDESDCWLWIDALCIDQSSKYERSHQIPLMGLIYSNANTVLGWLGPENHNIEQAFEFISEAAQYGVSNYCQSQHDSYEPVQFDNPFFITGMPGWQRDWRCFAHFAKLGYWTRRWIIQELILAESVVLQVGWQKLSMDDVEKFFKDLKENPYKNPARQCEWENLMQELLPESHTSIQQLERSSCSYSTDKFPRLPLACLARHRLENNVKNKSTPKLRELMHRYDAFECKEPSDTVYALYNLLGEHRQFLEVDYTQTPASRCISVLEFLRDHESMTGPEAIGYANFLYNRLCRGVEQQSMHNTELKELSIESSFTTILFDLCPAKKGKDSWHILRLRERTPPLRAMPKRLIQRNHSRWTVQPCADKPRENAIPGADISNLDDLVCFSVDCQGPISGLSTCSIKNGDRIWHPKTMNMAFVMRPKPSLDGPLFEMVGRAAIYPITDCTGSRWELDIAEEYAAISWSKSRQESRQEIRPRLQEVLLKPTELLDLAFWADVIGPESNPSRG